MGNIGVLQKAKDLISDPENWCRHALMKDVKGPDGVKTGVQFCSLGAIIQITNLGQQWSPAMDTLTKAAKKLGVPDVVTLNNYSSHEKVMEMFDLAICMEECNNA